MKFHAIGDSSPTNTLLKQEGLQLAEASCCDLCSMFVDLMSNWCMGLIVAFLTASLQISVMWTTWEIVSATSLLHWQEQFKYKVDTPQIYPNSFGMIWAVFSCQRGQSREHTYHNFHSGFLPEVVIQQFVRCHAQHLKLSRSTGHKRTLKPQLVHHTQKQPAADSKPSLLMGSKYRAEAATKIMMQQDIQQSKAFNSGTWIWWSSKAQNYPVQMTVCYITHIYDQRAKAFAKFNAIHKLGSPPIGCEDFSTPGSITNGVSVQGRPYRL